MSTPRPPGTQARWTSDEDDRLVSLFEHSDLTIPEIARKMSRAVGTVRRKLSILRKAERVGTRAVRSRRDRGLPVAKRRLQSHGAAQATEEEG